MRISAVIVGLFLLLAAAGLRPESPNPLRPGIFHYYSISLPGGGFQEVPEWTVRAMTWAPSFLLTILALGVVCIAFRRPSGSEAGE